MHPSEDPKTPTIALIGCGAIAEAFHLPAIARHPAILARLVLVDPDTERAGCLAAKHGITKIAGDYRTHLDHITAAIVATPHHLHYPVVDACLESGVHVLCEKPLAESPQQVRELVSKSQGTGTILAVNYTRRLFPSFQEIKKLLDLNAIGRIQRIQYYEGEKADWPSHTGFYFGSMGTARGVVLDRGAHALDLIYWWLGGKPELVSYKDDSLGGSEAVAEIHCRYETCDAEIFLSWLSRFKNIIRIEGEDGAIETGIYDSRSIFVEGSSEKRRKLDLPSTATTYNDFGKVLFDNFIDSIHGRGQPLISGHDIIASVDLIDECYAARARFPMPWHDAFQRIVDE